MPKLPALPYVRTGISNGLSANAAFREYQAAARQLTEQTGDKYTASRRTTFLQTYSQTRYVRGQVVEAMNAPKDQPGGGLPIPPRNSNRARGYLNWGVGFSRYIGSSDVEQTFHAIRSEEPLTPQQVENIIRQQIEESSAEAHGSFENHVVEGVVFTGAERLIPEGN